MEKLIIKLLKESEFDWIKEVPSFIEITEPIAQKNPKDSFRLLWTNGSNEEYGTWSDNWQTFKNDNRGIEFLTRYIKMLQNGVDNDGRLSVGKLVRLYLDGRHDYIVDDELGRALAEIPEDATPTEERDLLLEWLYEDLRDMGILEWDAYNGGESTIERWWVTYFDEAGVEYTTKINKI